MTLTGVNLILRKIVVTVSNPLYWTIPICLKLLKRLTMRKSPKNVQPKVNWSSLRGSITRISCGLGMASMFATKNRNSSMSKTWRHKVILPITVTAVTLPDKKSDNILNQIQKMQRTRTKMLPRTLHWPLTSTRLTTQAVQPPAPRPKVKRLRTLMILLHYRGKIQNLNLPNPGGLVKENAKGKC